MGVALTRANNAANDKILSPVSFMVTSNQTVTRINTIVFLKRDYTLSNISIDCIVVKIKELVGGLTRVSLWTASGSNKVGFRKKSC